MIDRGGGELKGGGVGAGVVGGGGGGLDAAEKHHAYKQLARMAGVGKETLQHEEIIQCLWTRFQRMLSLTNMQD